jgi:hypothetical protein
MLNYLYIKMCVMLRAVRRIIKTGHIHRYRLVRKQGVNVYSECRCGNRKVTYNGIGYVPIDVEWLVGVPTPTEDKVE